MSWRVVSIAERSYLSLRNNSLIIKQDEEFSVPLEDIGVLLIENHAVTTSMALLNACVQHKIAVFVCDDKHIPSGVLLGYQQHSRQSAVIAAQIRMTEPLKKRLWQGIVIQKIHNQQTVYEKVLHTKEPLFKAYIDSVQSGDISNREAVAARLYFSKLLPAGQSRSSECVQNHALNYGYAIIRGAIARSLVSYGFLSSVGIKHSNELNNFALADDIIESYRPFVDAYVFSKITTDTEILDKEIRNALVALLTCKVVIDAKEYTLLRATEITAQSLVTAMLEKDPAKLKLPVII